MPDPVVVIGGGPAGATAAMLLAKEGVAVRLLDRARFPRHHVGESLQPATFALLDRHFGLGPTFAAQGFARKYGAVYVWGERREPWTVLFDERLERDLVAGSDGAAPLDDAALLGGGYEHAWQVERARFDALLLEAARAQGVDVREGIHVDEPVVEGAGGDARVVGVRAGGEVHRAAWVLDASGQASVIGRRLGQPEDVEDMRAVATYAYYDGAGGVAGPLGRHVQLVVSIEDGWAWFIPVSAERTSVGFVTRERPMVDPAKFHAAVAAAGLPIGAGRLDEAEGFRFARDWSYRCRRLWGAGWTLVGDAACFVDPVLSGGVDFAIRGALNAAVALLTILGGAGGDARTPMDAYASRLAEEYRAYLRMARYWYGNNRSVEGFFWEAHRRIPKGAAATPLRAFVYLTSGRIAAERHFRVFQEWQEAKLYRQLGVDTGALAGVLRETPGLPGRSPPKPG
jgi:flavin-dependent dehydrogenase